MKLAFYFAKNNAKFALRKQTFCSKKVGIRFLISTILPCKLQQNTLRFAAYYHAFCCILQCYLVQIALTFCCENTVACAFVFYI